MGKFLIGLLIVLLIGSGFVYWNYYNVYSKGYREGVFYKFSEKGDVFKTWEGEIVQPGLRSIAPGSMNTPVFYFSVTNDALADSLNKIMGKSVKVHYLQYRKSLPWRGENYNGKNAESGQYIIDKIEAVSAGAGAVGF